MEAALLSVEIKRYDCRSICFPVRRGIMIQRIAARKQLGRMLACLTLGICCRAGLMAQNQGTKDTSGATWSVRHILGFEGISSNARGDLSIQDNELQFR